MLKYKKMQKKGDAEKSVDISEKMKRQVQLKVFIISPKRGNSSGQDIKWRQKMYCISSVAENIMREVPLKIIFLWHLLIVGFPL